MNDQDKLNYPKGNVNTIRARVLHLCVTSAPESQSSVNFDPLPTVFEVEVILRKVIRMTPIDFEHYQVKCTHICVINIHEPYVSFWSRSAGLELQVIVEYVHWSKSQKTLNTTSSKVPICTYTLLLSLNPNFNHFVIRACVFKVLAILSKVHCTPKWHWSLQG